MLVPNLWWEMKKSEEKAERGWEAMQKGDGAGGEATSSCARCRGNLWFLYDLLPAWQPSVAVSSIAAEAGGLLAVIYFILFFFLNEAREIPTKERAAAPGARGRPSVEEV